MGGLVGEIRGTGALKAPVPALVGGRPGIGVRGNLGGLGEQGRCGGELLGLTLGRRELPRIYGRGWRSGKFDCRGFH